MTCAEDSGTPTLPIGSVFQRTYEIVAELGAGSYGTVYRARRLTTGCDVAIKVLRLHTAMSAADRTLGADRFRQEMQLTAELWHPNIVRLLEADESAEGVPYTVFDLIPGVTLRQLLQADGPLSLTETIRLMRQVLDALCCAHTRRIVHRDLKPENIMVTSTGAQRNAVVLDFGLGAFVGELSNRTSAPATAWHELIGTPSYAAPEQLRGERPSPRSDLYSWALIFLECVTGEVAVNGSSPEEVVRRQLSAEPIVLPAWLVQHRLGPLLRVATAKQVTRRQVTGAALMEGLNEVASPSAGAVTPCYRLAPADRENRQLTVVSCRFSVRPADRSFDTEELDLLLHEHQSRCADLATRQGGLLAGIMADRIMLTFGYPYAQEDDARRAVRAALQIVEQLGSAVSGNDGPLAVHIGVHTGSVMVPAPRPSGRHEAPPLLGITTQIAAGIDADAADGEVRLSLPTLRTLRGAVDGEPVGDLATAYAPVPIPVFRLLPEPERSARVVMGDSPPESDFVGRGHQLNELIHAWAAAQAERPVSVCVHGEPGIGKSRLLQELRRHVPPGSWLETRCVLEHQATPLAPLIDLISLFDEPLETVVERYGFMVADTVPLLAALLSRPPDPRYPPLALSPERQKEQTLTVLVDLLLRKAEEAPTVFVLEDLQWADPTTLTFVDQLMRAMRSRRTDAPATKLCFLLTARPEFRPPWPADNYVNLPLNRLSEREVAAMTTAAFARGGTVPDALVDAVVRQTDGIPLFVEEVTRVLAESGAAILDGAMRSSSCPPIPGTLRDLLMARLDGLSPAARETAQLAGVLGREFRYEILQAVAAIDTTELRENLYELQTAGLVFRRRAAREETYVYRHALLRDAACSSLAQGTLERLHLRVATTLRHRFPEMEQHRPEMLAYHFEHGGEIETAVDYFHRAGSRALHRAMYAEALALLQRGLALLDGRPRGPARDQREVEILATLGAVRISTNGYSSVEVEETFARAWALCGEMGGNVPSSVLYGLWGVHLTRSSRTGTAALIPRLLAIADRSEDPVAVLTASACLGTAHYWSAEYEVSNRYLARGRRLFDTDEFQRFAQAYGYGVGLYSHAYGQLSLWMLGYPDQAAEVRRELLAIGERVHDPYCSAVGLAFGMTLAHDRDEPHVELDLANRLITLADEQRLPVWLAIGQIGRGGAYTRLGGARDAVPSIMQGLHTLHTVGVLCSYSYFLTYLAEAQHDVGDDAAALAVLDESTTLCSTLVARPHEPELMRLRGEVLRRRHGCEGAAQVESWFQRALALARASNARSYELRAAASLARLWYEDGRGRDARALLDGICDWFTEGNTTPDQAAAAKLRAEVA